MNHVLTSANAKLKNVILSTAIVASLALMIPGCRIPQLQGPDPAHSTPERFNAPASVESSDQLDENSACVSIDEFFDNPVIVSLIDEALINNQELKILNQEIQIAQNEIMKRRGAYLPFLNFVSGASLTKSSDYSPLGAGEQQLYSPAGTTFPQPLPNFLIAGEVSWQIDIWRQLRNARDAATLRYLGTCEGRNYTVTRLVAEIAEKYYLLLALDKRLETLDMTIELQEKSLSMSKSKKEFGRDSEFPVQRFQADVRRFQSEKLLIKQQIIETENRINFLAGRYPQPIERPSQEFLNLNMHTLRVGFPSQLLLNRTDIRQAERQLEAAGLDVKVARARFYPQLFITAGVGYDAFNTKYLLLTPQSLIYNIAGDLTAPVINRLAIKADYLSANAKQLQSLVNYQRTILNAFTEVINLTNKVENYGRSVELKKQQVKSLESAIDNAIKLYNAARFDYLEVLLVQRDLNQARLDLIDTKQGQLSAIVNAYQALGGGLNRSGPPQEIMVLPPEAAEEEVVVPPVPEVK